MRKKLGWMVMVFVIWNNALAQVPDPTVSRLFRNSYKVIDAMRLPGGIYLDALALGADDKPAALAANGVGLVSLCIADAMYKKTGDADAWDANAETKALQTINEWIRLKNTSGAVNKNGLFYRYFNPEDGSWVWVTEHSTIDNAILAAGFLFCRNYFNWNAEIVSKTKTLLNAMDFTAAIPTTSGNQMYMILDDNGYGSAPTTPFNEYLVLAWFAKNTNSIYAGYNRAQTYWNNYFSDATKLPQYSYPSGNATLSGGTGYAQPSFHVQFSFYYCHYFDNDPAYMSFFANQATADRSWWKSATSQQTAWGCGAGEIPGGGYSADAVNNNPNKIVSPHIMAGFSPVYPDVRTDLAELYANGTGAAVYKIPDTDIDFLWRYKFSNTGQRASYVQAVDFSTMLYGLAALPEYLGPEFFKTYNDFNFDPSTSATELRSPNVLDIYPNPTSGQASFRFSLTSAAHISIGIFTTSGKLVKQVVDEELSMGGHSALLNTGDGLPAGVYFCRMLIDNQTSVTKKMIITN